jgi:lipid-A-disaccharide synthase-like uncharacterized protein
MTRLMVLLLMLTLAGGASAADDAPPHATVKVKLDGVDEKVHVIEQPDGSYRFVLDEGGQKRAITPNEFAARVYGEQTRRSWLETLLNITSPIGIAWVVVGLLGQVLFTGRMLVQWLVSEKQKRSVVPPVFWWMSLGGATMLVIYFVWRKDIVGVLGQCTGWFIYVRNLWMIYRPHQPTDPQPDATDDPGPEPQIND